MKILPPYCTIYLSRHGETIGNLEEILQGQSEYPLTEKGKQQAQELANTLSPIHFEATFSSDLGRAVETAKIMAQELKTLVETSALLRERCYGKKFEGKPKPEYRAFYEKLYPQLAKLSQAERLHFRYGENMETDGEVLTRTTTFLHQVAQKYQGKNILVISHGGLIRILLISLGVVPFNPSPFSTIGNCGYVKLASDGEHFTFLEVKGLKE